MKKVPEATEYVPECVDCCRSEEVRDGKVRPIELNEDGICAACECANEEAAYDDEEE